MLNPKIEAKKSKLHNLGLFAKELIHRGEIIWQLDESARRFTPDEFHSLPFDQKELGCQLGDFYVISTDGTQYMNHSCNPNVWWEGDHAYSARRDIQPGEEITYDYSTSDVDYQWKSTWECLCGDNDCRKYITNTDILHPNLQEKYKGHLPSWTINFIKKNKI